jgi:tyrosyl-DNA phosphodiesterase 2
MDELVAKAIKKAEALKKTPELTAWRDDEPWTQPHYIWIEERRKWQEELSFSDSQTQSTGSFTLVLFSWNIDFMLPFPDTRMDAALVHLQELTEQLLSTPNTAVVIHLQECVPTDLVNITQKQWIRDKFSLTDIDASAWGNGAYGTTTLVDRRLHISSCFRVHYSKTRMERDALFIDIVMPTVFNSNGKKLRLCNTHLESLALEPPFRPAQMQVIASHMHMEDILGAVVMGDFNAIQPSDTFLHLDNGLKDAYLELGGREDSNVGYTWGHQALPALRERFGLSRMDKVFYRGTNLKLLSFERFGAGVEIPEEQKDKKDQLLSLGFEKAWITDHLGIKAVFHVTNNVHL